MMIENDARTTAMKIHPKYHAPIHRGSLLVMIGVRPGAMYIVRLNEAKAYPAAGPRSRMKYERPAEK